MVVTKNIEVIPTGLSRNYVPYWDERQALKEAIQNIVYGVIKSKEPFMAEWKDGVGKIADNYKGFGKNMLYIGESEQRDDSEGLGNFGEGWKIFLLVMARNNRKHIVHTVGFSFYGEMEKTPHGTEVLNICIEENDRKIGTEVIVECEEEDFYSAIQSFAILQNIEKEYITQNTLIPNRRGELWVNGILIEQNGNTNPLELHFSYNINDRSIMNRDRSQVNTAEAYKQIRNILGKLEDKEIIRELVKQAVEGNTCRDIQDGPFFMVYDNPVWKEVIAEVHGVDNFNKIVIPSLDENVNREALYRNYTLCKLPKNWYFELRWLGMEEVKDVVNVFPKMEEVEMKHFMKRMLQSAKLKVKKCLKLKSVYEFPEIVVVKDIGLDSGANALGLYSNKEQKIYITEKAFVSQRLLTGVLLHEMVHWKTGFDDNTIEFTSYLQDIILDLVGITD